MTIRKNEESAQSRYLTSLFRRVGVCRGGEREGGVGLFLLALTTHSAQSIPQDLASCGQVAVMFVQHRCP